jgi:hypothetical protein
MQQLSFDGIGAVLPSAGDNAGSSLAASSLDDTTRYQARLVLSASGVRKQS